MSVKISGVPLNNAKLTLEERIVGGNPTTIEEHPYQVKLLNYRKLNDFLYELKQTHTQVCNDRCYSLNAQKLI
jgi:hypothetical protein